MDKLSSQGLSPFFHRRKPQHEAIEKGLHKEIVHTPSTRPIDEGVSEGVARLLSFIHNNPGMRTPEISSAMGVPIKSLERWLKRLREEGKVELGVTPKTVATGLCKRNTEI